MLLLFGITILLSFYIYLRDGTTEKVSTVQSPQSVPTPYPLGQGIKVLSSEGTKAKLLEPDSLSFSFCSS